MQLEGPTAAGLMYSDTGGDGPVVVLLYGVLMNGALWDTVVDGLGDRYRCIVPEMPFGAHTTPMPDDADLSLPALATLIAEFLTDGHDTTSSCPPPTPNDSPNTSRTPSWCGSTTAAPSAPSTSRRCRPIASSVSSPRTRDSAGARPARQNSRLRFRPDTTHPEVFVPRINLHHRTSALRTNRSLLACPSGQSPHRTSRYGRPRLNAH